MHSHDAWLLHVIYLSICQDNPSDKDINQGALEVFNVDSSVSSDELTKIFGSYGEIKEVSRLCIPYIMTFAFKRHDFSFDFIIIIFNIM
jgi:RNA recognition motif-containing protein